MDLRNVATAAATLALMISSAAAIANVPRSAQKVTIDKAGRYCVNEGITTGSRIPTVECKSVADWAKLGVSFSRG